MESIRDIIAKSNYHLLNEQELENKLEKLLENKKIKIFSEKNQLTNEFLFKNLAVLQEFVSEDKVYEQTGSAKAVPGFKPVLSLENNILQVSYVKTAKQKEIESLVKAKKNTKFIDIPKAVKKATFSNLEITKDNSKSIVKIKNFAKAMLEAPKEFHQGIYLWGDFGRGKTYLMGALVNRLAEGGIESTIINTSTLIADLKSHFQEGNYIQERIRQLQEVPFLVLDDLGAESISDWSRDDVLSVILQYRMQEELPTCFTSNLSFLQLKEHFQETKTAIDEIKADRLMERIYFLASEEQLKGINRRH